MSGAAPPPRLRFARLRFAAYCLRRWTIDLVADLIRWARR